MLGRLGWNIVHPLRIGVKERRLSIVILIKQAHKTSRCDSMAPCAAANDSEVVQRPVLPALLDSCVAAASFISCTDIRLLEKCLSTSLFRF